ncbi:MAG TPA: WYL domain-containing protein [Holophagaceae bacterium]|nr:WYL domain-containing protein [Holophagaceae bacterium]
MPTKKTAKAEEPKPKKTAAKKAAAKTAEKAEPKPKAVKKAKTSEPEAPVEAAVEAAPKKAVVPKKAVKAGPAALTPHAAAILSAIDEGRAVEFIFEDAEANAPRTFEPRQLIFDTLAKAWYAWGWDRRYNAERFHCLDLLKEINAVEGIGRSAQGPYKDGTPGNLIGGWLGGDPIPVKVVLHKQWVFAVKQAPPAFPDFKLEEKEEGKAQASFTATDLRAIARWVMQFGDGITVVEPARLLDRIRQAAMAWGAKLPAPKAAPVPAPAAKPEHRHHEPRSEPKHESRHHDEPRRREHRDHHEDRAPKESKDSKVEVRIERL